jgi:hypothetical protein
MTIGSVPSFAPVWSPGNASNRQGPPPLANTAQLLGVTTDDLTQARQSGKTLLDLASAKGISRDELVKSIVSDLKAGAPPGAPAASDAQLGRMADNIAAGLRPGRGHHHHHHHRAGTDQSGSAQQTGAAAVNGLVAGLGSGTGNAVDTIA